LQEITLQRVDGAAFNLQTIDFKSFGQANDVFEMSFTFAGGGPTLYTGNVLPIDYTFRPITFNFTNLLSVTWKSSQSALLSDNVVVTSAADVAVTPVPPTLLLFATALAGFGWLGRRRREGAA
jgi:hypothetical protein